jgi:hypothetical protein
MKITVEIVSSRHNEKRARRARRGPDDTAGWSLIDDAWAKATEPGIDPDDRRRRQNWVGGALAVFAALTGQDAAALRDRLESKRPVPQAQAAEPAAQMPVFREGRSTPPPPRPPGAQRPVE